MRYFKALEIATKPLIIWNLVASTTAEYESLGFDSDPLVLEETEIPAFLYGVCPLKIVAGELVDRTVPEMEVFQDEFEVKTAIADFRLKVSDLNTETFTYDGNEFMMDEASRIYYQAIDKVRGNQKILTAAGATYTLLDASTNIDNFLAAYHFQLHFTIKPAI